MKKFKIKITDDEKHLLARLLIKEKNMLTKTCVDSKDINVVNNGLKGMCEIDELIKKLKL